MSNSVALFACSKCFSKHPFEELSSGQQLCKDCRGSFPIVKCTYCRSEFQQTNKLSTSTICSKCEHNVKQFGKPSACEYCNIIAAFIGNKCQRCTNSERKYGPPVTCEQCKQKCAFDRKDDDKKVDGKLLCWLCTLSFKRALAKTKQSDADRRAQLKLAAQRSNKNRENRSSRGSSTNNKRSSSNRSDPAKLETGLEALPPMAKAMRTNRPPGDLVDPNSSDHVVAMTQLKEQMASLQKQICQKDALLLTKDKTMKCLKRRITLSNYFPHFFRRLETLKRDTVMLEEEIWTQPSAKRNWIRSKDTTWENAVIAHLVYLSEYEENPKWSLWEQDTVVDLSSFGMFGIVLELYLKRQLNAGIRNELRILEKLASNQ